MKHQSKNSASTINESIEERRQGKRLFLNFSIEITGVDRNGLAFVEQTRTEDISDVGCRFETRVPLKCGNILAIKLSTPRDKNLPQEEPQLFEVIWVAERETGWIVGALKVQEAKIWKVSFPPKKHTPQPPTK